MSLKSKEWKEYARCNTKHLSRALPHDISNYACKRFRRLRRMVTNVAVYSPGDMLREIGNTCLDSVRRAKPISQTGVHQQLLIKETEPNKL